MSGFQPEDPLAPDQWHLQRLGDMARIWSEFTGAGIHVGVYDDGIQYSHHDLDGNYDASRHVVVGGITFDGANALAIDSHGTSVAGLIAAEANGEGTVGIAFGASLTGVNIFDGASALFINAADPQGFYQAIAQSGLFDVVNHSWGATPVFGFDQSLDIAGNFASLTLAGWVDAAANGRGGLGTVVVKSAGNDYRDTQGDGLNASRHTITVSAIGDSGFAAEYSNHGASVLVGAPGSEFARNGGLGIVTTDLLGTDGYNLRADAGADSDITDDFGGTSAAAPIVTAVVALMLDANAGLGWRDVQNILAASATHTGSAFGATSLAGTFEDGTWAINKADNWNGGGMHTHANYGYGAVNAYNAVRMAEVWTLFAPAQTSANEQAMSSGTVTSGQVIPDLGTVEVTMSLAAALEIEHVALTITFSHTYFTDLDLYLTSAEGTVVRLLDGTAGNEDTADAGLTWTFGIDVLRGETLAGDWKVTFDDVEAGDSGFLDSVALTAYGRAIPVDDVFHFTDEFAMMAALGGQAGRRTIADTDGGTDWINAAAVTTGSVINLNQNAYSSIAGGAVRIAGGSVIENAIGGDGDDLLVGNAAGNELRGMRGDDTMRGGAGADLYIVDSTRDVVMEAAGGGADTVLSSVSYALRADAEVEMLQSTDWLGDAALDFTGNGFGQAIRGNAAANALRGLAGQDTLHGFGGDDALLGGDDNDTLWSGDGNDTLDGGAGNDRLDGGGGIDTASYAGLAAGVSVNLRLSPPQNTGGGGTDLLVGIENLTGTDHHDSLDGDGAANLLDGGAGHDGLRGNNGDDTLFGGAGNDTLYGGQGADSLLGGDGEDVVSFTAGTVRVIADLVAGGSAGDAAGDTYLGIEHVVGTRFNDILRGDDGANRLIGGNGADRLEGRGGADTLLGGEGNDTLLGGEGADRLEGMGGNDTFVWLAVSETSPTARDAIRDWNLGDLLDLSAIDADLNLAGNQAFAFLGVTATPALAMAGELFVFQIGNNTFASAGVDGDGVRDLLIQLSGLHTLTAGSFIL